MARLPWLLGAGISKISMEKVDLKHTLHLAPSAPLKLLGLFYSIKAHLGISYVHNRPFYSNTGRIGFGGSNW